jgi:hypothetical protein
MPGDFLILPLAIRKSFGLVRRLQLSRFTQLRKSGSGEKRNLEKAIGEIVPGCPGYVF